MYGDTCDRNFHPLIRVFIIVIGTTFFPFAVLLEPTGCFHLAISVYFIGGAVIIARIIYHFVIFR